MSHLKEGIVKLLPHQPISLLLRNSQYHWTTLNFAILALVNELTEITVLPDVVQASNDLRDLNPDQRNCLFPDEGDLKLLQNYSKVHTYNHGSLNNNTHTRRSPSIQRGYFEVWALAIKLFLMLLLQQGYFSR